MHNRFRFMWFVFCLLGSSTLMVNVSRADTLASPEAARKLTDEVMDKVSAGDVKAGLELMKKYLILSGAEADAAAERIMQQVQPVVQSRYGKPENHEFISEKMLGTSLLRIIQLQKYENAPMAWMFLFYKSSAGWKIHTYFTSDQIPQLFTLP